MALWKTSSMKNPNPEPRNLHPAYPAPAGILDSRKHIIASTSVKQQNINYVAKMSKHISRLLLSEITIETDTKAKGKKETKK
jgi:hypothetical protein